MFVLFIFLYVAVAEVNGQVDRTLQPETFGHSVVQATVDRIKDNCIFPNDFLFLRRLALVESNDGMDTKTYRTGYHGGIWQVDESMFNQTLICDSDKKLLTPCANIKSAFNITWNTVKWTDLRKPLFSGLAASLFLQRSSVPMIPGDPKTQSNFWTQHYNKHGKAIDFINSLKAENREFCNARPIDLVFSLDESGSIGYTNFQKMKAFVNHILDKLPLGKGKFRIGLTKFRNSASTVFNLNTYSTVSAMKNAVKATKYTSGGTNIASAIHLLQKTSFQAAHGARPGTTRIALLITDGQSNLHSTTLAAQEAHKAGIVIFALGIGSINEAELKAAASDPDCTHVSILSDFSYIDNLVYEIKKKACRAYSSVEEKKKVDIPSNGTIEETVQIKPRANTTYILVQVIGDGIVYIYQSSKTSHPNSAFYEIKETAFENHPVVIGVPKGNGKPFYLNYVGKALNPLSKTKVHFTIDISKKKPEAASVVCVKGNVTKECTTFDMKNSKYSSMMCSHTNALTMENPCTSHALKSGIYYHQLKSNPSQFIRCNNRGEMYITRCPSGKKFYHTAQDCLSSSELSMFSKNHTSSFVGKLSGSTMRNPCTALSVKQNEFKHALDNTKYIRCNSLGDAFVMQCQGNTVWNQENQKCEKPTATTTTTAPVTTTVAYNPCVGKKAGKFGLYFEYPGDKSKFVQCNHGNAIIKSCPPGTIWHQKNKTCVLP